MRKVLSLDVGITTGFAVHFLDGFLAAHGEIPLEHLDHQVKHLVLLHLPSFSVVEFPVPQGQGELSDQLTEAIQIVKVALDRQYDEVPPSQWKPHPVAKTPCPRGTTAHERDAIRLGRYYLATKLQGTK